MLLALHKPHGVLSQFTPDHPGQRTLSEFGLPKNVYPLGRLDRDSEGLLLLSDEPGLNTKLLDPENAHPRTYWAQVEGEMTASALQQPPRGCCHRRTPNPPRRSQTNPPRPPAPRPSHPPPPKHPDHLDRTHPPRRPQPPGPQNDRRHRLSQPSASFASPSATSISRPTSPRPMAQTHRNRALLHLGPVAKAAPGTLCPRTATGLTLLVLSPLRLPAFPLRALRASVSPSAPFRSEFLCALCTLCGSLPLTPQTPSRRPPPDLLPPQSHPVPRTLPAIAPTIMKKP